MQPFPFLVTASDSTPEPWLVNLPRETNPSSNSQPYDQSLSTIGFA